MAYTDGFTFQIPLPYSHLEFSKIILIICTAVFIEKNYENLNTPKVLAKLAVFLAVPVGLIVAEPDLSTSICIMVTLFAIIFVGGLSLKLIGIMVLILVPAFGGFIWYIQQENFPQFLHDYQINRILGFLYGSEYGASSDQQDNSVMAIGSGQLTGKGINNSTVATVKDTNLISEQQTDFIFSANWRRIRVYWKRYYYCNFMPDSVTMYTDCQACKKDKKRNVHCGWGWSADCISDIYQYWGCNGNFTKYRTSTSIYQLWSEFTRQYERWYWFGT